MKHQINGLLIFGVIFIIIAIVLFILIKLKQKKSNHLLNNDTSKIGEIIENYSSINENYDDGSFSYFAELKGNAISDNPLITEFSKQDCCYYRSKVIRKYEVLNKNASGVESWTKKTDIVSEHENYATDFRIKDKTGEVYVDGTKSKLNVSKTFSKFERGTSSFLKDLQMSINSSSSSRTIGFTYEEYSIPVNSLLYILGEVNDRSHKLTVSKPKDKKQPFIISTETEDEMLSDLEKSIRNYKIGMISTAIIGVGMIIWYLIKV